MYFSRVSLKPDVARGSQLGLVLRDRCYGVHRLLWDLFESNSRQFLYREENAKEQMRVGEAVRGQTPVYYVLSRNQPVKDHPILSVETKFFAPVLRVGDVLSFKLRANPVIRRKSLAENSSVNRSKKCDVVMDAQLQLLRRIAADYKLSTTGKKRELKRDLISRCDEKMRAELIAHIEKGPFRNKLNYALDDGDRLEWALKTEVEFRVQDWFVKLSNKENSFELLKHEENVLALQADSYRSHWLPEKNKNAVFSSIDFSGKLVVKNPVKFVEMISRGVGPSKAFGCGLMMIRRD